MEGYVPITKAREYLDQAGVYEIICYETGRVYIGQSTSIVRRVQTHLDELDKNCHPNKLLQYDWARLNPEDFAFRLVIPLPYTDPSLLLKEEGKTMDGCRRMGIQLYNDFRAIGTVGVDRAIEFVEKQRASEVSKEALDEVLKAARRTVDDNKQYARPVERTGLPVATCYDCGESGFVGGQLYRCDDSQVRCERCVDKRAANFYQWVGPDFLPVVKKAIHQTRYRWGLDSQNWRRELTMACASYANRYGLRPNLALVHESVDIGQIQVPFPDVKLERAPDTPMGYIDFPVPDET